jgi:hypothetical protein
MPRRGVEVQNRVCEVQFRVSQSSAGCRSSVSSVEVRCRVSQFGVGCRSWRPSESIGSSCVGAVFRYESGGEGSGVRRYRSVVSFGGVVVGWRSRQSIVSPGPESADLVSTSVRRLVLSRRSPAMLRCWCYCYCCRCGGRGFGWLIVGCVIGSWKVEEARGKPEVICNEMAA